LGEDEGNDKVFAKTDREENNSDDRVDDGIDDEGHDDVFGRQLPVSY
jgi:hypothetical protein